MALTELESMSLEVRHVELHSFLKDVAIELGTSGEDIASWASAAYEKFLLIGIHDVHDVVARSYQINDLLRRNDRQMMFRNTLGVMC